MPLEINLTWQILLLNENVNFRTESKEYEKLLESAVHGRPKPAKVPAQKNPTKNTVIINKISENIKILGSIALTHHLKALLRRQELELFVMTLSAQHVDR